MISDRFMEIVETLPVNSKLLLNNLLFVIFNIITPYLQCLSCNHMVLSDLFILRKNKDVLHPHMAGNDVKHKWTEFFQSHKNI